MTRRYLMIVVLFGMTVRPAFAQDARLVLAAASEAMGAANLKSIEYSGTGWVAALGQSYSATLHDVGDGWPHFEATRYIRTIDYDARSMLEEVTRRQGNYPPRGGGGTPLQGEQTRVTAVNGDYAWNGEGPDATPAINAAQPRQLEIWLTPHGFIKAAMASSDLTAFTRRVLAVDDSVQTVTMVSFMAMGKYRLSGMFTDENMLEYVQTRVANPVFGDMLYEIRYTDYEDFDGIKFPTSIHGHAGASGYDYSQKFWYLDPNFLQVDVASVRPNVSDAVPAVPDAVRRATAPEVRVQSERLADGVWLIGGGSHNSVAVEFNDFVALIEAPLNEERSLAVMAEVGRLVPDKDIEYVVATHHHFDHIGGLRTYFSDGARIVTQLANRDFYERILLSAAPRTIEPDRMSLHPMPSTATPYDRFETLAEKYVLSDGERTMEIHAVRNLNHVENMVIAYLPAEKLLVNADLYSPPAPGAAVPEPNRNMRTLSQNLQRLGLDVDRHVPIHGRVGTNEEFVRIVGAAN